ncbi:putative ABC transporter, ATP-binding domain protein, partial [Vibrio parahaemolyticus V-223/04]
AR